MRIWEIVNNVLRPGTGLGSLYNKVQLMADGSTAMQKVSANVAVSATITNTTVETAFDKSYTIAANRLSAGDVIRIIAAGKCPSTNSTDTLTVKVKIGTTVLLATAAVDVANNDRWRLEILVNVRTIGASGTIVASGVWTLGVPGTATQRADGLDSTTIDTTATQAITVTATWSVANASNQTYLDQLDVFIG